MRPVGDGGVMSIVTEPPWAMGCGKMIEEAISRVSVMVDLLEGI